jgi:HlyD family secretion protein
MTQRTGNPWLNYLLGLLCVGAIVAAVLVVGPSSSGQTATSRTAKAVEGVVQSTVSGSGNLQPASQLNLGFKTTGTVTDIYVKQGQYVTEGKLLATLDPQSAEVTLEQAKAALQSAEASLAREEETNGEGSNGSATAPSNATAAATSAREASHVSVETPATPASSPSRESSTATSTTPSSATPGSSTTPATSSPRRSASSNRTAPANSSTKTSPNTQTSPSSSTSSTLSQATRDANIASARAAVKSDELTVRSDEQAVADTNLYAPQDGTIVSLSGQVGEVVSASGTTRASSAASSSSSTTGSSGSGSSGLGRTAAASASSSSNASSSSSAFAVLSDLSSMQLVVALSESEIGQVHDGQIATVTVEALEGKKLAAHVSEVATLSTSTSGVVSYDVTFTLDQMEAGLKPGMSATAEVVVKQAEGVSVPSSAISGGSVTVVRGGKQVRQRVIAGLAGNTSTIILSGLQASETVVLPAAMSTSSATSLTSRLSRLAGGGGLGGGRGGLVGGGGAAFFRGGG